MSAIKHPGGSENIIASSGIMLSILNHLLKDRHVLTYVSSSITLCLLLRVNALAITDVWIVIG